MNILSHRNFYTGNLLTDLLYGESSSKAPNFWRNVCRLVKWEHIIQIRSPQVEYMIED